MEYICVFFFFLNDTATTEIYPLSLHDALPISAAREGRHLPTAQRVGRRGDRRYQRHRDPPAPPRVPRGEGDRGEGEHPESRTDRKSTRLNSSHANISHAVFCLKKKKNTK